MALVTTAEFQSWVGTTDAQAEVLRQAILAELSEEIPRQLGDVAEQEEVLDGPASVPEYLTSESVAGADPRRIRLREPITSASLVAVEWRATLDDNWGDLAADLTDFELDGEPSRSLWRRSAAFPAGRRVLRVRYNAGFADDETSLDHHARRCKMLALELGKQLWVDRKAGGIQSVSIDKARVTVATSPAWERLRPTISRLKESTL